MIKSATAIPPNMATNKTPESFKLGNASGMLSKIGGNESAPENTNNIAIMLRFDAMLMLSSASGPPCMNPAHKPTLAHW